MKRWSLLLAGLAFVFAAIPAQEAEAQVTFGPQITLLDLSEFGVGARVDFGLGDAFGIEDGVFTDLYGSVNGNYLFSDPYGSGFWGGSDFSSTTLVFNANAAVPFDVDAAVTPFAGAGINLLHSRVSFDGFGGSGSESDTSGGLNLLGGIWFDLGNIPAFAELQYSTTAFGYLSLSGGVMFGG